MILITRQTVATVVALSLCACGAAPVASSPGATAAAPPPPAETPVAPQVVPQADEPLRVLGMTPSSGGSVHGQLKQLSVRFSHPMNPKGVMAGEITKNGACATQAGPTLLSIRVTKPGKSKSGAEVLECVGGTVTSTDNTVFTVALDKPIAWDSTVYVVVSPVALQPMSDSPAFSATVVRDASGKHTLNEPWTGSLWVSPSGRPAKSGL